MKKNADKEAKKLMEEAEVALRVAKYLELNGFENLQDAAAKGWGDTSPLKQS